MGILLAIVYEAMLPVWIIAIMFGGLIALLIGLEIGRASCRERV